MNRSKKIVSTPPLLLSEKEAEVLVRVLETLPISGMNGNPNHSVLVRIIRRLKVHLGEAE